MGRGARDLHIFDRKRSGSGIAGIGVLPTTGVLSGLTFAQDVDAANAAFIPKILNPAVGSRLVTDIAL
jgi:hypothetical protein